MFTPLSLFKRYTVAQHPYRVQHPVERTVGAHEQPGGLKICRDAAHVPARSLQAVGIKEVSLAKTKHELYGLIYSSKVFNSMVLELNLKRQERERTVILVSVLISRPYALLQTDRSPAGGRGHRSSRGPRWAPERRPADWILPRKRRAAMFVCRREVVRAHSSEVALVPSPTFPLR